MIIRQATQADAGAICDLFNAQVRDTLVTFTNSERSPEVIAQDIHDKLPAFLVAQDAGGVVGYANYGPFRGGPGYAHTGEHSIQVSRHRRGDGIGAALLAGIEAVARSRDIHVLVAAISGANPRSVAFHAHHGYQPVGRMPQVGRKDGQWLDLVLMQKILTADSVTRPG